MNKHAYVLEPACRDFEEDLVLYHYQDLGEPDRDRLEEHVRQCRQCGNFLKDLTKLLPESSGATEELPPYFWPKYSAEVMEKIAAVQRPWWRNLLEQSRLWMLPAFGTAAIAVLALGLVFGNGGQNSKPEPSAAIPQEILIDVGSVEFFKSMDLLESLSVLEKMDGSAKEPVGAQQL